MTKAVEPSCWCISTLIVDKLRKVLSADLNDVIASTKRIQNHGPLTGYAKLRVAHAPIMPGTFSPPQRLSDPDMHHGTCVTQVTWCMPGSLTSGFLLNWWRGKRSRHSRCMRNPQFCVSGKRPIERQIKDMSTLLYSTVTVGDSAPLGTTISADTVMGTVL